VKLKPIAILLFLGLSSCSIHHRIKNNVVHHQTIKPKTAVVTVPSNLIAFDQPIEIVSDNIKAGLECALHDNSLQVEVTDLGQSTEVWVKGAKKGTDMASRIVLKSAGNATIAEIVPPAAAEHSAKIIKSYGDTGRCEPKSGD
jgi:hypothetical protein